MAKFCTNCGKELVDGKCPNCGTKAAAPSSKSSSKGFGDILKEYWELLKKSVSKPFDVVKENNSEDKFITALIAMGVTSILGGVFMCAMIKSLLGGFSSLIDIPYAKVWFCGFAVFAVLLAAMALVGFVIFDKILKANVSIKKMFVLVGLSQLSLTFATVIITVLGFMLNADNAETMTNIIYLVLLFSSSMWMVNMIKGFEFYTVKVDSNKFSYAFASLYTISVIVLYYFITEIMPNMLLK